MKKPFSRSILILFVLFLSGLNLFAQTNNFVAGIFFNANGIHFEGDNQIFWQTPNGNIAGSGGLSGGISVKRNLSEKIYLEMELRYIQKGSVFEYGNDFGTRSVETMRINYVEIPILIGLSFQINKKDFLVENGLGYAKQISSEIHINKHTSQNEFSNIDNFRDDDFSWIGSLKFPANQKKKNNLLLGLRTSYSLKSIHNNYNLRNLIYGVQVEYLIK